MRWIQILVIGSTCCGMFACEVINNPAGSPQSRCLYGTYTAPSNEESSTGDDGFGREILTDLGCWLALGGYQFGRGIVSPDEAGISVEQRIQDAVLICVALRQWRDGCYSRSDSYAQ